MTKRLDPSFVKQSIELRGWLLHDEYKNNSTKMSATCDKGHATFIRWATWSNGSQCKTCLADSRRLDPLFVKQSIESEGWVLHDVYKNSQTKMRATCSNGHDTFVRWGGWKVGYRCSRCSGNIVDNDLVKATFEEYGYTLLSDYVIANGLLKSICPNGHIHMTPWTRFREGHRCMQCSKTRVKTQDEIEFAFKSEGYTLLSIYTNNHTPLNFICPKGHRHSIIWRDFNSGRRCSKCAGRHRTTAEVSDNFASEGYTLLSNYVNYKNTLNFICPQGHKGSTTWTNWEKGRRCNKCRSYGFSTEKPAILYYVRFDIDSRFYYKIGITNRTTQDRLIHEPHPYKIIKEKHYSMGNLAKDEESYILSNYKDWSYKGPKLLRDGNTELFIKDILRLDT